MTIRFANKKDIPRMQVIRNAVKENRLSVPSVIKDPDYLPFLFERGRGWVCEIEGEIRGFAFCDLRDQNIWALFVDPLYEHIGVGRQLQSVMLNWYFAQGREYVWLGTAPETRAARFYKTSGWKHVGNHGPSELKFSLTRSEWLNTL